MLENARNHVPSRGARAGEPWPTLVTLVSALASTIADFGSGEHRHSPQVRQASAGQSRFASRSPGPADAKDRQRPRAREMRLSRPKQCRKRNSARPHQPGEPRDLPRCCLRLPSVPLKFRASSRHASRGALSQRPGVIAHRGRVSSKPAQIDAVQTPWLRSWGVAGHASHLLDAVPSESPVFEAPQVPRVANGSPSLSFGLSRSYPSQPSVAVRVSVTRSSNLRNVPRFTFAVASAVVRLSSCTRRSRSERRRRSFRAMRSRANVGGIARVRVGVGAAAAVRATVAPCRSHTRGPLVSARS